MHSLYGVKQPRWYVRLRGLWWLSRGYCPCCYSSPPLRECPVCEGDYRYGPHIRDVTVTKRARWRKRFLGGAEGEEDATNE